MELQYELMRENFTPLRMETNLHCELMHRSLLVEKAMAISELSALDRVVIYYKDGTTKIGSTTLLCDGIRLNDKTEYRKMDSLITDEEIIKIKKTENND